MLGLGVAIVSSWILAPTGDLVTPAVPPQPEPIVGGSEAGLCQFPSTVAILEGDETPVMCSGTLVHPSVVTLAAHCINPERPIVGIGFGEQGQGDVGPARVAEVVDCVGHPAYFQEGNPDIAYCTLAQPVLDVPVMPILAGCELDLLEPDLEVTIVGFGSNYGTVVDGEVQAEGVGPKRFTTQTIVSVDADVDEVNMVGPNGSQSACFGDSGGPALVELPDGSWRVFGAASRLFDPGGFPPPKLPENFCGVGVIYGLLTTRLDWLEAETGYDLTPCHDGTGDWDPAEGCGSFPAAPSMGVGNWDNGCGGGPMGPAQPEAVCESIGGGSTGGETETTGEPADTTSTGASSAGDSSSTTGVLSGGTAGESGDAGSGETSGAEATSGVDVPNPGSGGSSSSSGGGAADSDAAGCGCRSGGPESALSWLLAVGLLGLRRRG